MAQSTKAAMKKDDEAEGQNDMQTLMEKEKERRMAELPKLREADQIDIEEKELQLIKDIFDSIPRAQTLKEAVQ